MNTKHILSFLLLIISFSIHSQTILATKTDRIITIDGDLTDWDSTFSKPFVIHDSGNKAMQETMVSLVWDAENLYIAFKCIDSKIVGSEKKKDSSIYKSDDLVEFFLDPDGDGKNYLELGVNAFSSNYDMLIYCISKDCGGWKTNTNFDVLNLRTASKLNKHGYSVEIKIPFSSLQNIPNFGFKTPRKGTKWKGNLFRIDYGNKTEYQSLYEYKSKEFGFHQPKRFPVLEFVE